MPEGDFSAVKYKCLSIVSPGGSKIAKGEKTIEVRSWQPALEPTEDLLIVENNNYLRKDGDLDYKGVVVAIVKVKTVREYLKEDIPLACANRWDPGYYSWELCDVRPVSYDQKVLAARDIYELDLDLVLR